MTDLNSIFSSISPIPFSILFVWGLLWKGLALWKSAKLNQRNWFVAILIINTFGILEIIYLFKFAKKTMKIKELMFWETK